MCTAVSYNNGKHFFGRNLDVEMEYGESVVITPRNFPFEFKSLDTLTNHFAIIGVAKVVSGFPLYFDGTNEVGLSIASLNFPDNTCYNDPKNGMININPYEIIPYILGTCKSVDEAEKIFENANITNINFSQELPVATLHWMISDKNRSIAVESMKDGLVIYENPVGVLTNNPPFNIQLFNLNNYMGLSANPPQNTFSSDISLDIYSRGMGAIGLPGDLSSASRFIKAVFTKYNSVVKEEEALSQFFHILSCVCQQKGLVKLEGDEYEYTSYSSCCDTENGLFYYTTYENSSVSLIDMHRENLDENKIKEFPIIRELKFNMQN